MRSLSLPIPVSLFIRRLFNVFSSITISNQYYILQKTDADAVKDSRRKPDGSERLDAPPFSTAHEQSRDSHKHWGRLIPWPWIASASQPASRKTHTIPVNKVPPEERMFNEKSSPPSDRLPSSPDPPPPRTNSDAPLSPIYTLMNNPTLFDPIRVPRNPIVLCHGLYGYDVRGPSSFPKLQLHYWANVLKILKKKIGVEVIVTGVPGTGSIESRAGHLDGFLREKARGRDINFVAHSMGGLDCRYLITHMKPREYRPLSLTTICTPHRGSPFMDWCKENIGIGKLQRQAKEASDQASGKNNTTSAFSLTNLPSSLTTFFLSVLDSPAYADLTTHYLQNVFNPTTPDDPGVRYYSVAARTDSMSVLHPLWLPKTILDAAEAREREMHPHPEEEQWGHDGLVSVRSARWGEFLGTLEGCDHWDVRGGRGLSADNDWNVDLALPSALKNSLSDPLSNINWKDWTRFVGAWRKEEEQREKDELEVITKNLLKSSDSPEKDSVLKASLENAQSSKAYEAEDAALKSSTDKLSAVFDWIAEQVVSSRRSSDPSKPPSPSDIPFTRPTPPPMSQQTKATSPAPVLPTRDVEKKRVRAEKASETKDVRMKFDLERFYVALSRKLYDDGF